MRSVVRERVWHIRQHVLCGSSSRDVSFDDHQWRGCTFFSFNGFGYWHISFQIRPTKDMLDFEIVWHQGPELHRIAITSWRQSSDLECIHRRRNPRETDRCCRGCWWAWWQRTRNSIAIIRMVCIQIVCNSRFTDLGTWGGGWGDMYVCYTYIVT